MYFVRLTGPLFLTPFLLDKLPVPPAKPSPSIPSVGAKPQLWLSPAFTSSQQGPGIGDLPVLHTASPQHQRNCSWLRFFCLGRFSWLCPQILALLGFAPGNPEPTGRIYSSTPSSRNEEMPCKTLSWEGSSLREGLACPPAWRNTHGQHRVSSPAPHLLKGGRKFCLQGAVTKSQPENPRPNAERNHCAAKNSTQCKHSGEKKIILS